MSSEKRAFGGHMPILIVIAVVAAIGLFVSPVFEKVMEGPSPYSIEISNVKQLTTACAAFAADHGDGKLPESLDELYPDYMDRELLLMFKDRKTKESKPYTYFPNLTNNSDSGTPLIASPVIKSKEYDFRIVGYVGGHVLQVREDEYRKMISK